MEMKDEEMKRGRHLARWIALEREGSALIAFLIVL